MQRVVPPTVRETHEPVVCGCLLCFQYPLMSKTLHSHSLGIKRRMDFFLCRGELQMVQAGEELALIQTTTTTARTDTYIEYIYVIFEITGCFEVRNSLTM